MVYILINTKPKSNGGISITIVEKYLGRNEERDKHGFAKNDKGFRKNGLL